VLVAAVGNSDEAYATPWPWASYPAALPHVIGVGALNKTGGIPDFSDRDAIFNDLVAPGVDIFSTFPVALTAQTPTCTPQGYTICGTDEYRHSEGTSFAAPQVAAAAAVLLAVQPDLRNSQVANILERSADDVNAANGCRQCPLGRDAYSGWGRLDVAKAVEILLSGGPLPPPDAFETNDNAGTAAYTLWGTARTVKATLDYFDDPFDVYRIQIRKGDRLNAKLSGAWSGANVSLMLWRPGTSDVLEVKGRQSLRAAASIAPGAEQHLVYRSQASGWYYVEVRVTSPGAGAYTLELTKTPSPAPAQSGR
jgi:serine protease